MKRSILTIAALSLLAIALFAMSSCKASGMAMTEKGQLFKINISAPDDLPDGGQDNIDVLISNRGVRKVEDIFVDVELPPQLTVLDQTQDRGVSVTHDPGTNVFHFQVPELHSPEDAHMRFKVQTRFGTLRETGAIDVTAWSRDLPNDKLFRKTVIRLRA
jgi:hypothetical protein